MSKINELRTQRAKAWEKAQAFLTANRDERGILSDENVKIYEGLEQDIVNLGKEIDRQERLDAMEREMAAPVSTPITEKPENTKKPDTKVGRASDAYTKAFWTQVRASFNCLLHHCRWLLAVNPRGFSGGGTCSAECVNGRDQK